MWQFCRNQKSPHMKNFEEAFGKFGQLLEENRPYLDPGCSFTSICSFLKVDPEAFGDFIFSRTGFDGEEVLEIYRRSETGRTIR